MIRSGVVLDLLDAFAEKPSEEPEGDGSSNGEEKHVEINLDSH